MSRSSSNTNDSKIEPDGKIVLKKINNMLFRYSNTFKDFSFFFFFFCLGSLSSNKKDDATIGASNLNRYRPVRITRIIISSTYAHGVYRWYVDGRREKN